MNRFYKISSLLLIGLFLLLTGVNTALEHLTRSSTQNSFTLYNESGKALVAYNGDLNLCTAFAKPEPVMSPRFLHRTGGTARVSEAGLGSRWF